MEATDADGDADADGDGNGVVRYRVRGGSGGGLFGVDASTGEVRVRTDAHRLDRDRWVGGVGGRGRDRWVGRAGQG